MRSSDTGATVASSEGMQNRQSTGRTDTDLRKRRGEELGGVCCEGLTLIEICVTFLCAQSRTEKQRARERVTGRKRKLAGEKEEEAEERMQN